MNRNRVGGAWLFATCLVLITRSVFAAGQVDRLDPAEYRYLQIGLIISGDYAGRIDGEWGRGSQTAFADFAKRRGLSEDDALAAVARTTSAFVEEYHLGYRHDGNIPVEFIGPEGDFRGVSGTNVIEEGESLATFQGEDLFSVFGESDFKRIVAWHEGLLDTFSAINDSPYIIRKNDRWVTALSDDSGKVYLWSEPTGTGTWILIQFHEQSGVDPAIFMIAAGSASVADGKLLELPERSFLAKIISPPESRSEPFLEEDNKPNDDLIDGFKVNNYDN